MAHRFKLVIFTFHLPDKKINCKCDNVTVNSAIFVHKPWYSLDILCGNMIWLNPATKGQRGTNSPIWPFFCIIFVVIYPRCAGLVPCIWHLIIYVKVTESESSAGRNGFTGKALPPTNARESAHCCWDKMAVFCTWDFQINFLELILYFDSVSWKAF